MGDYYTMITNWRKTYEQELGAPDGWLSISGLYWLKEGENRIGADASAQVILPRGSAPRKAGVITLQGAHITLKASQESNFTSNNTRITDLDIQLNEHGSSEWVFTSEVKFAVIQRDTRYGVRVYDPNNPARRKFYNVRWFAINENFCIQARYHLLDEPVMLTITNVIGNTSQEACNGYVEFLIKDQLCKLYPLEIEDGKGLWFMFKDASNQNCTYSGGRFLFADAPQDNIVTLDFNKAHNPPCAYTNFATCPLPPSINNLPVEIPAGEMEFPTQ